MSLDRRLKRLEKALPSRNALGDDPEYQFWRWFYEAALEVLEPFPEALAEVKRNVGVNEPLIFRPDWQRTASGADTRFYWCKETLWAALQGFPEAHAAMDEVLTELEKEVQADEQAKDCAQPGGSEAELPPLGGGQ